MPDIPGAGPEKSSPNPKFICSLCAHRSPALWDLGRMSSLSKFCMFLRPQIVVTSNYLVSVPTGFLCQLPLASYTFCLLCTVQIWNLVPFLHFSPSFSQHTHTRSWWCSTSEDLGQEKGVTTQKCKCPQMEYEVHVLWPPHPKFLVSVTSEGSGFLLGCPGPAFLLLPQKLRGTAAWQQTVPGDLFAQLVSASPICQLFPHWLWISSLWQVHDSPLAFLLRLRSRARFIASEDRILALGLEVSAGHSPAHALTLGLPYRHDQQPGGSAEAALSLRMEIEDHPQSGPSSW